MVDAGCAIMQVLTCGNASSILAADVNGIEIGSNTNIQDNVIVHVAKHSISGKPNPTVIGNNVTVGK